MDYRKTLVKLISLLWHENIAGEKETDSGIQAILDSIKLNEGPSMMGFGEDTLFENMKKSAYDLIRSKGHDFDSGVFLQQYKLATRGHDDLYSSVVDEVMRDLDIPGRRKAINHLRRQMKETERNNTISTLLHEASRTMMFKADSIDVDKYLAELLVKVETNITSTKDDQAVIANVSMKDISAVAKVYESAQDIASGKSRFVTGFQGLNVMIGGGFVRGDFVMTTALQHKYKTGLNITLFKDFAIYTPPHMLDESKMPCLVRISFEDEIENNFKYLYRVLKHEETGADVSVLDQTPTEIAEYVYSRLSVQGYELRMLRLDPSSWSFRNILDFILKLESEGYEVQALFLDYLSHIPTTGLDNNGPMGANLRELFRRVRNITAPRKITLITPHQLSPEAKRVIRTTGDERNFTREAAGKGYTSGSTQLDQEVDIEIVHHVFRHGMDYYLAMTIGKNRNGDVVPEEKKTVFYKFPKTMPIPPDYLTDPRGLHKLPDIRNAAAEDFANELGF